MKRILLVAAMTVLFGANLAAAETDVSKVLEGLPESTRESVKKAMEQCPDEKVESKTAEGVTVTTIIGTGLDIRIEQGERSLKVSIKRVSSSSSASESRNADAKRQAQPAPQTPPPREEPKQ